MTIQPIARDAIDDMLAFHAVARRCVSDLRRIAADLRTRDDASVHDAVDLAETIVRELGMRRVLHELDEVESLLPRLATALSAAGEVDPEITRQIEEMADEHAEWEAVWRPIQFWLWMVGVDNPIVTPDEIAEACEVMEDHLLGHIGREEATVYAAARRLLGADDLAAIADEMSARRRAFTAFGPTRRVPLPEKG